MINKEILHQEVSLTTIQNICSQTETPHSFLFYGNEGVGKFSSATFFAKSLLCEKPTAENLACNECSSCLKVFKYNHPNLFILSNDDRLPYVKYYLERVKKGEKKNIKYLYNEIYLILSRYQNRFLSVLEKAKKKDFPEGFPLKTKKEQEKMDTKVSSLEETLKACIQKKDFTTLDNETFFEEISQVQNCLDRSILKKESITKLFSLIKIYQKKKRVIIINDINKMDTSVIGGFLKILEEPPANTIFLLISKNWQSIDNKITLPLFSRCIRLKFNSLSKHQVVDILAKKYKFENPPIQEITNSLKTTFKNLTSSKNVKNLITAILNKKKDNKSLSVKDAILLLNQSQINADTFLSEMKQILKQKIQSADEKFYLKFRILQKIIQKSEEVLSRGNLKEENILTEFLIRFYQFY